MNLVKIVRTALASTAIIFAASLSLAGTPIDVKITGMTCGSCVEKVQAQLSKLKGIEADSVKVELAGNHATLVLLKDDAKARAAVEAAVVKAGYKVASIDTAAAAPATKAH